MTASHDQQAIKTDYARVAKTRRTVQIAMNVVTIESPIPQGDRILFDYASQFNNALGSISFESSSGIK